jgi:hypothetical protein
LSPRFPSSPRPSFWVRLRALIFLSFFYLGRSPITMKPFLFLLG